MSSRNRRYVTFALGALAGLIGLFQPSTCKSRSLSLRLYCSALTVKPQGLETTVTLDELSWIGRRG